MMLQPAKSPYGHPTRMCHTTLKRALENQPKVKKIQRFPVNGQRRTTTTESQCITVKGQRLASFFVLENTDYKNNNFGRY